MGERRNKKQEIGQTQTHTREEDQPADFGVVHYQRDLSNFKFRKFHSLSIKLIQEDPPVAIHDKFCERHSRDTLLTQRGRREKLFAFSCDCLAKYLTKQ